jgi:hypothetical protein
MALGLNKYKGNLISLQAWVSINRTYCVFGGNHFVEIPKLAGACRMMCKAPYLNGTVY